jgi:transcriptional regulator with XRE-family HTH domain
VVDEPRDTENVDDNDAIDELGRFIKERREGARLSLRKLAGLAGVSNPYLSQIERGLRKPSAEILQAIAKALEVSSETLYVKAGILEERPEHADVQTAIEQDPLLSDAQRQTLLEMYRTFRRLSEIQSPGEGPRRGVVDRVIRVVSTGDVDDEAVAAAALRDEDADEA